MKIKQLVDEIINNKSSEDLESLEKMWFEMLLPQKIEHIAKDRFISTQSKDNKKTQLMPCIEVLIDGRKVLFLFDNSGNINFIIDKNVSCREFTAIYCLLLKWYNKGEAEYIERAF